MGSRRPGGFILRDHSVASRPVTRHSYRNMIIVPLGCTNSEPCPVTNAGHVFALISPE